MPYKNKEDQSKCHKKWYEANKGYKKLLNKRYKIIKKEMVFDFKSRNPCPICGEDYPRCLDFHHFEDKDDSVSALLHKGVGLKKIVEEINKCCILCSNCHRKADDGFIQVPEEFRLSESYDKWNIEYKKRLKFLKKDLGELRKLATLV